MVTMGLGWDPAPGRRNIDLDASAIGFDASGRKLAIVWFTHLNDFGGALRHGGDNLTGAGEGDDEQIHVDLQRMPAEVASLVFTITSFGGQKFTEVARAFCRLVDASTGQELVRYDLSNAEPHSAVLMAMLRRTPSGAVGDAGDRRVPRRPHGEEAGRPGRALGRRPLTARQPRDLSTRPSTQLTSLLNVADLGTNARGCVGASCSAPSAPSPSSASVAASSGRHQLRDQRRLLPVDVLVERALELGDRRVDGLGIVVVEAPQDLLDALVLGELLVRDLLAAVEVLAHGRQQVLLLGDEVAHDVGAQLREPFAGAGRVGAQCGQIARDRCMITAQHGVDRVRISRGHAPSLRAEITPPACGRRAS